MVSLSDSHLILHAIIIRRLSILRGVHFASGVAWEFLNTMDIIRFLCKLFIIVVYTSTKSIYTSALPSLLPRGRTRLMLIDFIKLVSASRRTQWNEVCFSCADYFRTFARLRNLELAEKLNFLSYDDPFTLSNQLGGAIRRRVELDASLELTYYSATRRWKPKVYETLDRSQRPLGTIIKYS